MPNFQSLVARATDSFTEVIAYYLTILAASGLLFSYFEDKPLFESFWRATISGTIRSGTRCISAIATILPPNVTG